MQSSIPQPVFLNVEFIFSWLWGHISWLFTIQFIGVLEFLASILVILGIAVSIYSLVRLAEMKKEDAQKAAAAASENASTNATSTASDVSQSNQTTLRNETWENIRSKLLSDSPSDWRLAIIEADIYLDRLLDRQGYGGDTLGDKLKNLTTEKLASLQMAWEAHKVRNRIAHDGAAFTLTMPEARRVLSYYEIVFRDLGVIE